MKKWIFGLVLALIVTAISPATGYTAAAAAPAARDDMRGIWLSYMDYAKLGMTDVNEKTYINNVESFLDTASDYDINTVFLHVRSYDDAIWKSRTFPASPYLTSKASREKCAADTYDYDPLADFIEAAQEYDIEVHAWLNPYRIAGDKFLDPGKSANINRVKKAVNELAKYDVAGIHFDDYFYHSQGGYVKNYKSPKLYARDITPEKKRKNVNKLVKNVHKLCQKKGLVFGVSPQGNYWNDMNSGADVKTWLSQNGYVDYLIPQIYWTNRYGAESNVAMFSEKLKEFDSLHTNNAKMYAGLALYRCGIDYSYDHGWVKANNNMVAQIKEARQTGWSGFVFYSASYLYNSESAKERNKYMNLL